MVSKAVIKYVKSSPNKVRLVLDLIRGVEVEKSFSLLSSLNNKASRVVSKLLKSAVANASEKGHTETETLYVKDAHVNHGPALKRFRPRAMGRANSRKKRMSHITVELEERGL